MSQRLQLYFPEAQYRELKALSRKRRQPMAVLVREAVQRYLPRISAPIDLRRDPLFSLVGVVDASGEPTNFAEEHDKTLYPA